METKMLNDLLWAKEYVIDGINEGFFEPEDWSNLTDEEFIEKAKYMSAKGDYYANETSDTE